MAPTPTPTTLNVNTFTVYAAGLVDGKARSTDLEMIGTGQTSCQATQLIHANMKDHGFTELYGITCESDGECDCFHATKHFFLGLTTMEDVMTVVHPDWKKYALVTFLILE